MYTLRFSMPIFALTVLLVSSCYKEKEVRPDKIRHNKALQEYIVEGWNTWNNSSYLNHVLMPEGLSLRIVFRKSFYSDPPYFLSQEYLLTSPNSGKDKILLRARNYDASYTDLKTIWNGVTARIQTATDGEDLLILYTPETVFENRHLLILESGLIWDKRGAVEKKDNFVQALIGSRAYRIGATSNDLKIPLPLSSPYLTFESNNEIGFFTGKTRSLDQVKKFIAKSEERYNAEQGKYGRFSAAYGAMQNLLAWNQIYDPLNQRAISTISRSINETWGGYMLAGWKQYFIAAMYAFDNKWHAYSNIWAVTNSITSEGFIPVFEGAIPDNSSLYASQPPVGSIITNLVFKKHLQRWFLKEAYDGLLLWNRWWDMARHNKGYLSWGSNPQPGDPQSNTKEAALLESGMPDSPVFDDAIFNPQSHMLELASVGLISLYIADCKNLAEIAGVLGKTSDKQELLDRAEKYSISLNKLWDDETGIYRDRDLITGQFTAHLSPTHFYPLLAGVPDKEQAERMINEHLLNPDEFFGEYLIPSIARNAPGFSDNSHNRGRISGIMNFLVYLGLKNYDFPEVSKMFADKSANLVMKQWIKDRRVYESYNAETGEGEDISNNDPFCITGGLLSLLSLMEENYW